MAAVTKKELILEGLCCANCAAKIETKVKEINGVSLASMNFINKTLTIETEEVENFDNILDKIKGIVSRIEPHVVVKEKTITKTPKKVLLLMGLCCANCASKIEREVSNLSGVKTASVDFASQKLTIEIHNKHELNDIMSETRKIVSRIEPDVKVVDTENNNENKGNKSMAILDGLG